MTDKSSVYFDLKSRSYFFIRLISICSSSASA